jgi:hypothetical protein
LVFYIFYSWDQISVVHHQEKYYEMNSKELSHHNNDRKSLNLCLLVNYLC